MRFNLDPKLPKVIIIALLMLALGVMIPTYTIVSQGRMPTEIEMLGFFLSALITFVLYLLTFVETGAIPTNPTPPTPP